MPPTLMKPHWACLPPNHTMAPIAAALLGAVQGGVAKAEHAAAELLERIRKEVNAQLAAFSRLHRVELQSEPFEKTPSQKIKRFLYPRRPDGE